MNALCAYMNLTEHQNAAALDQNTGTQEHWAKFRHSSSPSESSEHLGHSNTATQSIPPSFWNIEALS